MPDRSSLLFFSGVLAVVTAGCAEPARPPSDPAAEPAVEMLDPLQRALSFHASFDAGSAADFARGDPALYTAPSYDELGEAVAGIASPDLRIAEDAGRFGGALEFTARNRRAIFYYADRNVARDASGWSGTVSFWLKLDPALDLEPGFCDPIQITDSAYNDAAVWVDFTKDEPRQFRLGVFGDLHEWNPDARPPEEFTGFTERLVVVDTPPFSREAWTHVAITYSGLGGSSGGRASLYLDGALVSDTRHGIDEAFTWDSPGTVRLGLSYVGLFDELALFDRSLTGQEIAVLHRLDEGVAGLRP